jgi:3-hydroxyisobutyrate dehydrogenase
LARAVAAAAAPRGQRVLDAPVGGSPERAGRGALTLYVGGAADDLERCRPVLETLAEQVLHVGAHGSGYAVKLLVNALWFAQAVGTAEAFALGRRLELDPGVLHEALKRSAAGGRFLDEDADALLSGDARSAFPLRRCCDELAAVLALGAELDVRLDLASAVSRIHADALERYGDVNGELLGARLVVERTNDAG